MSYEIKRKELAKLLNGVIKEQKAAIPVKDPYTRGLRHGWDDALKFAINLLELEEL